MIAAPNLIFNQDIVFIFLTISLLLIGVLKSFYWKHTKLLLAGVFAQRYVNQFLREENAFTERVNFITFFLMIINFSILIFKYTINQTIFEVLKLITLIALFYCIKILVMLLLGYVFKMKDIAKLAIFFSLLFDKVLGFVLFPFIVILYFFPFEIAQTIIHAIATIFSILLLLKIFWLCRLGAKSFGFSAFYIFLYLCGLEIFPLLILAKGTVY